jgi:hypothetical protein
VPLTMRSVATGEKIQEIGNAAPSGTEGARSLAFAGQIGLAIEVHRHIRQGLLESFLCCQPAPRVGTTRQSGPARSRNSCALQRGAARAWLPRRYLVDETVILEMNAVPPLLPAHDMQLQSYWHISGLQPACC